MEVWMASDLISSLLLLLFFHAIMNNDSNMSFSVGSVFSVGPLSNTRTNREQAQVIYEYLRERPYHLA